ncbi:MAG: N-6 DNA methylase [Gemmatimonadetes bacterium]|nr:N-6 DNA methylase [Gemmatimonadota bacterium]
MAGPNKKLVAAVEAYFADLRQVRASGGATAERSYYPALEGLLRAVGATLKPKVFCVQELADQGAGHPDLALYTARQVQKGQPRPGQIPERGVVEVKGVGDDAWLTAGSGQVSRYWSRYRLVLVTNLRNFVLVGADAAGSPAKLETFTLAEDAEDFWRGVETPRAFARKVGAGLGEYLARVLSHRAALAEPKDLAWLLASYARDGLARVEAAGNVSSLLAVRSAMEEALGIRFEGERGERFFRSTLIQTLFYGIFSAWVLWSRDEQKRNGPLFEGHYGPQRFRWREAVWHLRAPVLRALFQQLADPSRLKPLGLVEVLDWTSAALDRVDRTAFFSRFNEGEAVPYFYEPFLEAFDPVLRKQLGVWYTPTEVVRYMVARVDRALKDDLGIPAGLAAENVYVLDPCCGTGAYLAEVLRRISRNLNEQGLGALAGAEVRRAATERVFGFEIMPAPFVVAHLQVGLTMQGLDAPLADNGSERAGVFLTNALTGWEPHPTKPLPFPELEEERDLAESVKQDIPILVILGNPPYNGFAGVAVDEEQQMLDAYRTPRRVAMPDKRGLHDLYVRFFRMAERRIAEKTGQGMVCFISNYSWLDGRSFAGMRERLLDAFDVVRIDCLNGDVRKGGKTPSGAPDPSIFTVPGKAVGIQVGTAITTLVRKPDHKPAEAVGFRHLWGQSKPAELIATAEADPGTLYSRFTPSLRLGLPFAETAVSPDWFDWPLLPDLFPVQFSGVNTNRDGFVVDISLSVLKSRIADYFDTALSHQELAKRHPVAMEPRARYDPVAVRDTLLSRGSPHAEGFVRYAYRPFDTRWLYWEPETKLLNEKRPDYRPHVSPGNLWLSAAPHLRKDSGEPQACVTRHLACLHLIERGANLFPAYRLDTDTALFGAAGDGSSRQPNLTQAARRYLERLGASVEDLFHHVVAVLHDPDYLATNSGALRMEWPRIPLPDWPDGKNRGAAQVLARSAARGRLLAALLDSETPVPGVNQAPLRSEIEAIAVPCTVEGRNMIDDDFAVTAGWGRRGRGDAVNPGNGRWSKRAYRPEESKAVGAASAALGDTTLDVYLNDEAFWGNVPSAVWDYRLGGYQVLKKWLSYRESAVLGRGLLPEEVQHFTDTARRIGALLIATSDRPERSSP